MGKTGVIGEKPLQVCVQNPYWRNPARFDAGWDDAAGFGWQRHLAGPGRRAHAVRSKG